MIILLKIMLVLIILSGCSTDAIESNKLVRNNLQSKTIGYIEIQEDVFFKKITKSSDINLIIDFLNDVEVLANGENQSANDDTVYRVKIYDKNEELTNSFSFVGSKVYYRDAWYSLSPKVYASIKGIYEKLNYSKLEDILEKEIVKRKLIRKDMPVIEALKGTWVYENGERINFDNEFLYQGNEDNYTFKYHITKNIDNRINVSVYGMKGLFSKDRKLSDMYIEMDSTRTHMKLKKVINESDFTYYDNLIYVDVSEDKNGDPIYYNLGSFDSVFFLRQNR